jgi:hypothetical protein
LSREASARGRGMSAPWCEAAAAAPSQSLTPSTSPQPPVYVTCEAAAVGRI